jgi:predicted transport protein
MRELFNAFRTEVIALNPCVTEEFLKLYVAYKAETNFVDVSPASQEASALVEYSLPRDG